MSKPQIGDEADCRISLTTSCVNLAMDCIDSNDTQTEVSKCSNAANEVQDFCDAPPGEVSQDGQFKLPKAYLGWSYTARKNKKWLEYDPTQLKLSEYLPITDTQVKKAVAGLKDLQSTKQ